MTIWQLALAGIGTYALAIAAGWAFIRWQNRRRKPMPPLIRRIPGRPVDGEPLNGKEKILFYLLTEAYDDLPAADPQEKP